MIKKLFYHFSKELLLFAIYGSLEKSYLRDK